MGIGRKTRIQAKIHRREVKREQYKVEIIRTISVIFLIGLTASLIIVKIGTIAYPIVSLYVKETYRTYRGAYVNPHLQNNLKYEDFKSHYHQKEPVLFPSPHQSAHVEAIWGELDSLCNGGDESDVTCPVSLSEEKSCHRSKGPIVFNFSTSPRLNEVISTPKLVTQQNTKSSKPMANFRGDVALKLLLPLTEENGARSNDYPAFQQRPHSWNELVIGRMKWYLYKPGTLPSMGFNDQESFVQWMKHIYPSLNKASRPVEIIQEEGQVLYIPEGWYRASLPISTSEGHTQSKGLVKLHQLLTSCGGRGLVYLHGESNETIADDPPHTRHSFAYSLSIQQEASAPEIFRSEYFHAHRGIKLLSQSNFESAIESLLRGTAHGADVEEIDMTSNKPFSERNDYHIVYLLGTAYAAVGSIAKAEKSFLFAITLNRLNVLPRIALMDMYLNQHLDFMVRSVLGDMEEEGLTHPNIFIYKYLSNFERKCKTG